MTSWPHVLVQTKQCFSCFTSKRTVCLLTEVEFSDLKTCWCCWESDTVDLRKAAIKKINKKKPPSQTIPFVMKLSVTMILLLVHPLPFSVYRLLLVMSYVSQNPFLQRLESRWDLTGFTCDLCLLKKHVAILQSSKECESNAYYQHNCGCIAFWCCLCGNQSLPWISRHVNAEHLRKTKDYKANLAPWS